MTNPSLLPAGYMLKRVAARPDWLVAPGVDDIYSVSGCISADFADYIGHWRHNGFWLFDNPRPMVAIATAEDIDLSGLTLFYYELFPQAFHEDTRAWSAIAADPAFVTAVEPPPSPALAGYDVATFSQNNKAECSPLSCNHLAGRAAVNRHCLFTSLDAARAALDAGLFDRSEPGPFRIVAVHRLGPISAAEVTPAGPR
ncbi:hypothetical protein [Phreatobacter sp. AB_2022a]|uniref:hypothetical protein n=1 Tax=Phreatobacter sp. AB_2022a TaxID=3003134 RepID=UPI002286E4C7|nr:hypothetical protein [Phreatobacter sp. AB_2022a]MCZ0736563.1 hypothetical protein [Phreatobacter sp. AB_2022a]